MRGRKKGKKEAKSYYHISRVSQMFNLHPQTLRLYEREGLLKPSRSQGNTRLYTDEDLKRLELILNLIRDLGVNLAGVEVIINMRQKMQRMEAEVNELLEYIKREFYRGDEDAFEKRRQSLVRLSQTKIVKLEDTAK
ncbi:MAG: MerR family transcriptional regulator [Candidatus Aminicenantales bacterium]